MTAGEQALTSATLSYHVHRQKNNDRQFYTTKRTMVSSRPNYLMRF